MKVIKWISADEVGDRKASVGGLGGFFEPPMRWKDYIEDWRPEFVSYMEAIRESVLENKLRLTGEEHQQNEAGIPLFDDGTVGQFSYRAWGDLMAAIWSEAENKDYHYMDFYM